MTSCGIDVKEQRYLVVTEIPGVFPHADIKETIHMVLEGTIAEHIAKLDQTIYRKYVWHNKKGKPMLYVQLKKGVIWKTSGGITFLESTVRDIGKLVIHNQPK